MRRMRRMWVRGGGKFGWGKVKGDRKVAKVEKKGEGVGVGRLALIFLLG